MNDLNQFERLFMGLLVAILCANLMCIHFGVYR